MSKGGLSIAFQGETGAYSEEAAFSFFGSSIKTIPYRSLDEVFKAVQQETMPYGIVPVENSQEGSISRVYDLFLDYDIMVRGETEIRITHCLITNHGTKLGMIKKVYSHPQALAQCHRFLQHLSCELIPVYDTAGSVKMIKEKQIKDGAAIASFRAAEIYKMKVIADKIEDNPNNFTRFFVLAKQDSPCSGNDKTSIVFSLKHRPGALHKALGEFALRGVNLTKIESRPAKQRTWDYNFYLDFEGHREDKAVREAIEGLAKVSNFIKILGSYPKMKEKARLPLKKE